MMLNHHHQMFSFCFFLRPSFIHTLEIDTLVRKRSSRTWEWKIVLRKRSSWDRLARDQGPGHFRTGRRAFHADSSCDSLTTIRLACWRRARFAIRRSGSFSASGPRMKLFIKSKERSVIRSLFATRPALLFFFSYFPCAICSPVCIERERETDETKGKSREMCYL